MFIPFFYSETPPNALKTQIICTARKRKSILLFYPRVEVFCLIVIFPCTVQTPIITLLRNVMLTVPNVAWATCGFTALFTGKILVLYDKIEPVDIYKIQGINVDIF